MTRVSILCAYVLASCASCAALYGIEDRPRAGAAGDAADLPDRIVDGSAPEASAAACRGEPANYATLDGGAVKDTCAGDPNADLLGSNGHCGRCGHACVVGSCQGGVCTPEPFPVTTIPRVVGAYGTDVFYCDENGGEGVYVFHLDGGTTDTVTTNPYATNGVVVSDGTSVYVRRFEGIYVVDPADAGLDTIVSPATYPATLSLAILGDQLVFNGLDGVYAVPAKPASEARPLAGGNGGDVAVARSETYWFDEAWRRAPDAGTILSRTDGGVSVQIATDPGVATTLTLDNDMAYYFRRTPAVSEETDAGPLVRQALMRVRLDGAAAPEVLDEAVVPALDDAFSLVVGAEYLFWLRPVDANHDYVVMKRAKCGGAAVPISTPIYTRGSPLVAAGDLLVVANEPNLLVISP